MALERRRTPAVLSALYLAIPVGAFSTGCYLMLVRGRNMLEKLSLREDLTFAGVVFVQWLIFWALISGSRRRSG